MQGSAKVENMDSAPTAAPVDAPPEQLEVRGPPSVRNISLWILTAFATMFVLQWGQAFFIPLVVGILITYALSPLVTGLENLKVPRVLGAAIVLITIVGGISYSVYTLRDDVAVVVEQLPTAVQKFTRSLHKGQSGGAGAIEKMQKAASDLEQATAEATGMGTIVNKEVMRVQIEEPALDVRSYLWLGSMGALMVLGQVVMVLFLVYFLLVAGDLYKRKLVKIAGPTLSEKKITVHILDDINTQIQRYMLVQVFTSALVGVASWIAFRWMGLEHAGVWAIAAGLLNSIPYLGPVIVTSGIALVAFLQFGTFTMALLISGISLVITSLEGFLLTPWLTSRAARMNAAVVFIGLLFWTWLWGVWGVLLAIPIMMVIKAICDRIEPMQPLSELLGE
ncbi:MAG TPA: AI-2E family transporter [Gammaproteobacteria bacterium]|nr:AI-2E family transporter [Gammaproteobacteria bacterium]